MKNVLFISKFKWLVCCLLLIAGNKNIIAQSCCCTGAGANYAILPNLNKHIIGLRYSYRNYYTKATSLNPDQDGVITNQQLSSVELFGRFNVHNRLQLSVFLPVTFIQQQSKSTNQKAAGLGDMSFLLHYNVLDPLKCNGQKTKHQLRIGAGLKLPSGTFKIDANDMFSTNLQLGTGSIDFITNAIYTFRLDGFGFNTAFIYRANTANPQLYQFGDKLQVATNLFYVINVKEVQLMPTVGINFDHQFKNKSNHKTLNFTGGEFITALVGFDVYYKQFAFSTAVSPALLNKLNWSGENRNKVNFEAGIFYNFSTDKKINTIHEKN